MPRGIYPRSPGRPFAERFWAKVEKTDGCWLWTGGTRNGYPHFAQATHHRVYGHRLSWEMANGPIPGGLLVCHHCDVRLCVRPDHLFLGTDADNLRDMSRKGRSGATLHPERMPRGEDHWQRRNPRTQCSRGHPYPESRYVLNGHWYGCRVCRSENGARRYRAAHPT